MISGNVGAGIRVEESADVQVGGNYIGTDATGSSAIGNGAGGVVVSPVGLRARANVARLTGNVISGNRGDGVFFGPGSSVALTFGGNYIGTNAAGTAALGNTGNGVFVGAGVYVPSIGDPGPSPTPQGGRNIISANGGHGIVVLGAGGRAGNASGVRALSNNYIGTDVTGTIPMGNGGSGIYTSAENMTIGGSTGTAFSGGNLISANGGDGITLFRPVRATSGFRANNLIVGNRIGTAAAAASTLPAWRDPGANVGLGNHSHGIAVLHSIGNRIGSGEQAGGNVIAYNDGSGVLVRGTTGTPGTTASAATARTLITANAIYGNGKLGIDLATGAEGVTPNDPLDADTGPNALQNYPVITEAVVNGTGVRIAFVLNSEPSRTYRIEFFASPLPDPGGYGEGSTFLGLSAVTTGADGSGRGTFAATNVPAGSVYFTATAIADKSMTSEFSPAVQATPPQTPRPNTFVRTRQVIPRGSVYATNGFTVGEALLPGQSPTIANVTNYGRGINDVRVGLAGLDPRTTLTADDFEFLVGNGTANGWAPAPAPLAVTAVPDPTTGRAPDAVYDVTWADGAIRNTWLRVTVKANERTGLAAPDVFYFGNLIGDIRDSETLPQVTQHDVDFVKAEIANHDSGPDFNLDFVTDEQDLAAATANLGQSLALVVNPPPTPAGALNLAALRAQRSASTLGASRPTDETITQQVLG